MNKSSRTLWMEYSLLQETKDDKDIPSRIEGSLHFGGSQTTTQRNIIRKFKYQGVESSDRKLVSGLNKKKFIFVNFGRPIAASALAGELLKHKLLLADPVEVEAWNCADPKFASEYPNATQWLDERGKYCSIKFSAGLAKKIAHRWFADDWGGRWWFVCVTNENYFAY